MSTSLEIINSYISHCIALLLRLLIDVNMSFDRIEKKLSEEENTYIYYSNGEILFRRCRH